MHIRTIQVIPLFFSQPLPSAVELHNLRERLALSQQLIQQLKLENQSLHEQINPSSSSAAATNSTVLSPNASATASATTDTYQERCELLEQQVQKLKAEKRVLKAEVIRLMSLQKPKDS